MNKLTRLSLRTSTVALGILLGSTATLAAEPCPWQGTEHAVVCPRWNALSQRLDAAEARAQAAEKALQSLKNTLPPTGQAQPSPTPTTPTAEQRVRTLLDGTLGWIDQHLQTGPARLLVDHHYTLQPQGDAYVATFHQAALVIDHSRIDFSPLQVTVEPLAGGDARIALQLPASLPLRHGDKTVATLTIGDQQLSGIWSDTLQAVKDLHLALKNVQLKAADEPTMVTLGQITAIQALTVGSDDQWHNQQHFALVNLQVAGAAGKSFHLASITGDAQTSGTGFSRMRQLSRELQQLAKSTARGNLPVKDLLDKVSELLKSIASYQFEVRLSGIQAQQNNRALVQLGQLNLGSRLTRTAQNSTIAVHFGLHGMKSAMIPLPPDLTPDRANLRIALADIPHKLLDQLIQIGLDSEQQPPSTRDDFVKQQLLKLLGTSGLELRITDTYVAAPEARADLKLRANVDQQAAFGGVGEMLLKLTGLDKMMAAVGGDKQHSAAAALAALMAFSNRTEQNGKTIDEFDLQLTKDGKLMLNHKDVTAMFMPQAAQQAQ